MSEGEIVGGGASKSTAPASGTSVATDVSLREHLASRLHDSEVRLDQRHHDLRVADWRFAQERDRRYTELETERDLRRMDVDAEREKAAIAVQHEKERALSLAREIQDYKDEKANDLRSQIESERGLYPTRSEMTAALEKIEVQLKPLSDYVTSTQGRGQGISTSARVLIGGLGIIATLMTIITIYSNTQTRLQSQKTPTPVPVVITVHTVK